MVPERTSVELKKIAEDIHAGRILTSEQVSQDMLQTVFMPLNFMDETTLQEMKDGKIAIVFGEMKNIFSNRSTNGYPSFATIDFLTQEQWVKVVGY